MDHIRVLRRAFEITRAYRALWVFGLLVALFTGRSSGGGGTNGMQWQGGNTDLQNMFRNGLHMPSIPMQMMKAGIGIGIALLCLGVILAIVFMIIRYVANTALVRMVDEYEGSGVKLNVSQGFRLGWSRGAFRTWLVDLLVGLASFLVFIILFAVAAAPLLLWFTRNQTAGIIGTVITVLLAVLVILILVVAVALLSLYIEITRRVVILENLGVFAGLQRAWQIVRRHLGDVIIMGLLLFGVGIVFSILMIPLVFLLLAAGAVIGGLPGLVAGLVVNIFSQNLAPVVGVIVGLPLFLAVLIIPLVFIGGLYETYTSSVWTLVYRELITLEAVHPRIAPNVLGDPSEPVLPEAL